MIFIHGDLRSICSSNGEAEDSNSVVEISLKIAQIFQASGENGKAEQGYIFCVECQRKKIARNVGNDEDTIGDTCILNSIFFVLHLFYFCSFVRHGVGPPGAVLPGLQPPEGGRVSLGGGCQVREAGVRGGGGPGTGGDQLPGHRGQHAGGQGGRGRGYDGGGCEDSLEDQQPPPHRVPDQPRPGQDEAGAGGAGQGQVRGGQEAGGVRRRQGGRAGGG